MINVLKIAFQKDSKLWNIPLLTCAPKKYTLKKSSLTWGTLGGPMKGFPRNSAAIFTNLHSPRVCYDVK